MVESLGMEIGMDLPLNFTVMLISALLSPSSLLILIGSSIDWKFFNWYLEQGCFAFMRQLRSVFELYIV